MAEQINRLLWVAFFNGLATVVNFIVLVTLSNRLDTIIGQLAQIARTIHREENLWSGGVGSLVH